MWDRPYTTMDFRFEAEIVRVFKRLVERGFVYRGLRPTLWSPTAQTALHQQAVPEGASFLQKPFTPSALTEKIREVLESRVEAVGTL